MIFSGNPGSGKNLSSQTGGKIVQRTWRFAERPYQSNVKEPTSSGNISGIRPIRLGIWSISPWWGSLYRRSLFTGQGGREGLRKEAIDALVKAMEDHKDNLILILAGYRLEMNTFIETIPVCDRVFHTLSIS
jgi:stage V sporulation protein K